MSHPRCYLKASLDVILWFDTENPPCILILKNLSNSFNFWPLAFLNLQHKLSVQRMWQSLKNWLLTFLELFYWYLFLHVRKFPVSLFPNVYLCILNHTKPCYQSYRQWILTIFIYIYIITTEIPILLSHFSPSIRRALKIRSPICTCP